MAISHLLPRKTMGSKTLAVTLHDRIEYDANPKKTQDGELVSSYQCSPESAAEEYLVSKQLYEALTGRSQPKERDIIMYRIIQSFKPGEISPDGVCCRGWLRTTTKHTQPTHLQRFGNGVAEGEYTWITSRRPLPV